MRMVCIIYAVSLTFMLLPQIAIVLFHETSELLPIQL